MKYRLAGIAVAAMLLALPLADPAPAAAQQINAAFSIPMAATTQEIEKITTALKQVKGVTNVTGLTRDNKLAIVSYVPAQVSVHQIAQAVADTAGIPGKTYQASLLVRVANLIDAATREKATTSLKRVVGVAAAAAMDANAGILAIQFAPLAAADKAGGTKGATQEQITKALADAGLEATAELTPDVPAAPPPP